MKNIFLLSLLAAAILLGGCNKDSSPKTFSNMSVKASHSSAANYPVGSLYAFFNLPSNLNPGSEEAMIHERIQRALADELAKKGYKPGSVSDAQFFVMYSLQVQQEIDVLVATSQVQGNEWIAAILTPEDYVGGALFVQIVDAGQKAPVWLGVFNANIELTEVGEQKKKERAAFAVSELLKSFPPK